MNPVQAFITKHFPQSSRHLRSRKIYLPWLQELSFKRTLIAIKVMHGNPAGQRNAFISMLKKDGQAHRMVTDDYLKHWKTDNTEEARDGRKVKYMSLVNNYYDLATDLYEEGWAQSFHFCRFAVGESLLQALARHEHYLAYRINLQEGMKVLDVGCGVGRPAREIAAFTGCNVVGLNNNSYQIERAIGYAKKRRFGG